MDLERANHLLCTRDWDRDSAQAIAHEQIGDNDLVAFEADISGYRRFRVYHFRHGALLTYQAHPTVEAMMADYMRRLSGLRADDGSE